MTELANHRGETTPSPTEVQTPRPAFAPVLKERVGFSVSRVWIIAGNTLTEAVRQKVFNFFLIIGLIFIASASFFAQFTFGEQLKFIKDTCLGVISVISTLIAIVGTAQLLPSEVENRTIYTILAKPVRRIEFLLGKFLGSLSLLTISIAAMCLLFGAVLFIKEQGMIRELRQEFTQGMPASDMADLNQQIRQVPQETFDVNLVKAVLAELMKATLVAAITLLISTFSTSLVFNVAVPFMIFVAGMLRGAAAEVWADRRILMALLAVVPDFGFFSLADEINMGNVVPWSHVGQILVYGVARTVVIVFAAHLIFSRREI
ncbi:MAG TPA: ABC transporter permease [Verrucomicrobiae bacterium]|nr:ABC transporter permease [Verrucomicrobiae bacterium]